MLDFSVSPDFEEAQKWMKAIISRIGKTQAGAQDYANLLGGVVYRDIQDHFKAEEGSEGPWDDWSAAYADHMRRIGKGSNKILQDTGRLKMGFTKSSWRATAQGILWYNKTKSKGGFPYGELHNQGGRRMSKRDFMWISDDAMTEISQLTLQYILDDTSEA